MATSILDEILSRVVEVSSPTLCEVKISYLYFFYKVKGIKIN